MMISNVKGVRDVFSPAPLHSQFRLYLRPPATSSTALEPLLRLAGSPGRPSSHCWLGSMNLRRIVDKRTLATKVALMNVNRAVLYLGCFSLGIIAGLRSLTAPALVSWAAHLGWLDLSGSRLSFLGSRPAITILSLLALGELVADKLPKTPKRTNLGPLVFRAITGAFSSLAISASAHQSPVIGTILGVLGAIAGAFAGYEIRHRLVVAFGLPDFGVALAEDIVAIGGGLLIVSTMF